MKKRIAAISMAVMMAASLAACGGSSKPAETTAAAAPAETKAEAAAPEAAPAEGGKVLVGAEPAVDGAEIPGVVAVGVALKNRGKVYGVGAQADNVIQPGFHPGDPMRRDTVVHAWCSAEPQGIDLIKNAVFSPHVVCSFRDFILGYCSTAGLKSQWKRHLPKQVALYARRIQFSLRSSL